MDPPSLFPCADHRANIPTLPPFTLPAPLLGWYSIKSGKLQGFCGKLGRRRARLRASTQMMLCLAAQMKKRTKRLLRSFFVCGLRKRCFSWIELRIRTSTRGSYIICLDYYHFHISRNQEDTLTFLRIQFYRYKFR